MARILVIDDDNMARMALTVALEELGHTVESAEEGGAGIALLGEQSFDLVITDLIMPGKEGIQTLTEIKADRPEIKVMAVSGGGRYSPHPYLDAARELGADAILAKPFTMSELEESLKPLLA